MARLVAALLCLLSCWVLQTRGDVGCINDLGQHVDWWFAYKVNDGLRYAYFDGGSAAGFRVVNTRTLGAGNNSCVERTLDQVYSNKEALNWLAYNDDDSEGHTHGTYAHSKGALAYASDYRSGFWLIHSEPKFPDLNANRYWFSGSDKFGQSFLCLSVAGQNVLQTIGTQLRYKKTYVYSHNILGSNAVESINSLMAHQFIVGKSVVSLPTKGGMFITHFARSGNLLLDIMEGMISPHYGDGFIWETWRRTPKEDSYCKPEYQYAELNVDYVRFADGTGFKETQDHAKIGVRMRSDILCIGGLNRMTSQDKRGGGYACFSHNALWHSLNSSFVSVENC